MKREQKKRSREVFTDPSEVERYMKNRLGLGESFDLGVRKLQILKKEIQMYYINGLANSNLITEIIVGLVEISNHEKVSGRIDSIIYNRIVHQSVARVETMDETVDQILSGLIAIFMEGERHAYVVDVRDYPGRQPEEPDTEKVVRGSRDGFVENIIQNTALLRRRIRDERLRFEMLKVGERSKTDVAIGYLKDVANPALIDIIRKEIEQIEIDGLSMADKMIEEYLVKQGFNPYPLVRYTERADVASVHLLEGHVLIIVDTSPSVIIAPTTFFHHVQHAEEYRQSAAVGTFIRWIRFLGIWLSIYLLPLWLLFVLEPELLPKSIDYIGPNKDSEVPVFVQLLIADVGVEFLRIAAIHTPTPLSTAMGIIAAVLIGEIAVEVGLFVSEVILYVSIAAIGTFSTPSYELSLANKIARVFLLIATVLFKVPGFVIGSTLFLLFLVQIRVFQTPYLWPFIPFHPGAFIQVLIRYSTPNSKIRPSIVQPRNWKKQA
jgi:Bacillus/Clostridium GerA spore germination protein.